MEEHDGGIGMTQGQRKVHVLLWLVLGPVAVAGLVLAVVWRPAEPVQRGALPGVDVLHGDEEQAGQQP
ncbi:MAG: hypothetical protein AAGC72_02360 [Planctomycetota bacterium]